MRIRLTQLRRVIREELLRRSRLVERKGSVEGEERIIRPYEGDSEAFIPKKALIDLGIDITPELDYHVVYGRIVGQDEDGADQEYWDENRDQWKEIKDDMRNHPRSRHVPDQ